MNELLKILSNYPAGVSASQLEKDLNVGRTTVIRYLNKEISSNSIKYVGDGPNRKYVLADPLFAIKNYFEVDYTQRPVAKYNESFLIPKNEISKDDCSFLNDCVALDKKEMVKFLIDFSCASSALEGGTYTLLDTQVLLEYGEKNPDKPLADAYLVLNHKNAFEYLFDNKNLSSTTKINFLLTDSHNIVELANSPHFLPQGLGGVARENKDVNIAMSSYYPPYRPGTGYVGKMLDKILETADNIQDPISSSFYLLTRLPYLQPFSDGNKRTSRVMCNVPLLNAGLPPISFVDFNKKDYVISMLAYYELGDLTMAKKLFLESYEKSALRLQPLKRGNKLGIVF